MTTDMRPRTRPVARGEPEPPAAVVADALAETLEEHEALPDAVGAIDPELRYEMIKTAAYYIAEQRGFAPGDEVADWLAAETAVDCQLRQGATGG